MAPGLLYIVPGLYAHTACNKYCYPNNNNKKELSHYMLCLFIAVHVTVKGLYKWLYTQAMAFCLYYSPAINELKRSMDLNTLLDDSSQQ